MLGRNKIYRIYKITHYNVARNGERECIPKGCWRQQEKSNPEMEVIWVYGETLSIMSLMD